MKVYLIDNRNNGKVVDLFDTVKEAKVHIDNEFWTTNTNVSKMEFHNSFSTVKESVMDEQARLFGKGKSAYFN